MIPLALSHRIERARADRIAGRYTARRLLLENGLSFVLLSLFVVSWMAQSLTGWQAYNHEQQDHGQPAVGYLAYLSSGHFLEATSENWESEFLQMAAFVWLTSFLFQRGSPESKDPYEPEETAPLTPQSPWPARRGGWVLKLYQNSLSITFFMLFLISFFLHAASGARAFNHQRIDHGQPPLSILGYLGSSQFWFESFQNWQSEFLSIVMMVVLAIFLRQRGSPESKPVQSPHSSNQ
ncbi:DUF6766 family protein [Fontivita pretiosa]|uniref:DUF6766 family protein n=1 Tax=Fontivita pretiosa TaxID=2989684 RepID=UPI003D171409